MHKSIPMGGGLGGGSADAAFVLRLLNEKFDLGLSISQLLEYAATLGSDVPFFIINKPCYATGRGEVLEEIALDLSAYKILIVNPNIHELLDQEGRRGRGGGCGRSAHRGQPAGTETESAR